MQKGFWLVLLGVMALMIGVFFVFGGEEQTTNPGDFAYEDAKVAQQQDHKRGDGPVVLIEYGDFQCPGCASIYPIIKQLEADRAEDLTVIFRHFPLTSIHANAMASHRAAEAAHKQGKFWPMHDMLYEQQDLWASSPNPASIFEDYADELGLNLEQFRQDVADESTFQRISADMKSGQSLNITGTPSFILNGEQLSDIPQTLEAWNQLIDEAL